MATVVESPGFVNVSPVGKGRDDWAKIFGPNGVAAKAVRAGKSVRMLPGVYGFGIVLAALFTSYVVYQRFKDSALEGLVWLVLGPLMFFGLVTALRITLEFVLAVFRVAWYVEQVTSHTETVSQELPRFGFLRTLLFGEKAGPKK